MNYNYGVTSCVYAMGHEVPFTSLWSVELGQLTRIPYVKKIHMDHQNVKNASHRTSLFDGVERYALKGQSDPAVTAAMTSESSSGGYRVGLRQDMFS